MCCIGKNVEYEFKYKFSHVMHFLYDICSLGTLYKNTYSHHFEDLSEAGGVTLHFLNFGAK
jgi:hypothetical protein